MFAGWPTYNGQLIANWFFRTIAQIAGKGGLFSNRTELFILTDLFRTCRWILHRRHLRHLPREPAANRRFAVEPVEGRFSMNLFRFRRSHTFAPVPFASTCCHYHDWWANYTLPEASWKDNIRKDYFQEKPSHRESTNLNDFCAFFNKSCELCSLAFDCDASCCTLSNASLYRLNWTSTRDRVACSSSSLDSNSLIFISSLYGRFTFLFGQMESITNGCLPLRLNGGRCIGDAFHILQTHMQLINLFL